MTIERVVEIAEGLGWRIDFDEQDDLKDKLAELSQYSPAGEDFSFIVYYDDADDLVEEVYKYYMDFDPDEHASIWVKCRGKRGVPSSIRILIEDAEAIEEMIGELSTELNKEE